MASNQQSPSEKKPSEEKFARLVERASMINLIHEALLSTLQVDELFPIMLGMLVSRQGMGFSRAILLSGDIRGEFRFHSGLGAEDAETDARVRAEIVEQQEQLERKAGRKRGEDRESGDETPLHRPAPDIRACRPSSRYRSMYLNGYFVYA